MKIRFVHIDFFSKKKRVILSPFVFFIIMFLFTDICLQDDCFVENFPEKNGFLIAEKPVTAALIGGKELFSAKYLHHGN